MSSQGSVKKQVPVMEGLFTWPADKPKLIANKCKSCNAIYFPTTFRCANPDCRGQELEEIQLPTKGKLWSYTIDYYPLPPPYKSPKEFKPFGVGEVEFPGGMRIAGQITDCDPEKDLKIDMDMELVFEKLYDDDEGNEIIGWKFKPAK